MYRDCIAAGLRTTAGSHYITFKAVRQNDASDGYEMGIDSFSISPSGCSREGEEAVVYADSGDTKLNENMSDYGSWSGDRHLEYQATAENDYISFSFYYDEWIETNFATCSKSNVLSEYSNRT